MRTSLIVLLAVATLVATYVFPLFNLRVAHAQVELPVPREQAVIFETDVDPTVFDKANPFIPMGTQWGSGWHQVVNEWDWYINYITGEKIMWRIKGWEYNEDFTKFTLFIREGVKWNDGVPYTADDVIFSINLQKEHFPDSLISRTVESARKIDDLTVEITLKRPDPRFHHVFRMWGPAGSWIVAKHVWEGKDPKTFTNWPPVETGPYKLYKVFPDLKMFVWERVEDYWAKEVHGKFPLPKYVIFRRAPPPDIDLADFIAGLVDAPLPFIFTFEMVKSARQYFSEFLVEAPFMDPIPLGVLPNNARYPLSLPEVRWAISHLINREKLATIYPLAETFPTKFLWADWGNLRRYAYSDIYAKFEFDYNPEKAAKILDDLGFKRGPDGIRVTPNGTRLEWTIISVPAPDPLFLVASDLAEELKKIGIDATHVSLPHATFAEKVWTGDFDIATEAIRLTDHMWISGDLFHALEKLHSSRLKPIGETSVDNWWRYSNPELDRLIDQMAVMSPDDPAIEPLNRRAVEILLRDLPAIPVVEKMFVQVFSSKVWTGWPSKDNMYIIPFQWWPLDIFILFELRPAKPVTFSTVWFLEDVPSFKGADGKTYGPFKKGESASIPADDASRLIEKGLASYTPPTPEEIPEIGKRVAELERRLVGVDEKLAALDEGVKGVEETIGNVQSTLLTIQAVTLVLVLVVLVVSLIRRPAKTTS